MLHTRRVPEAISVRLTADILGVHISTIRRWIRLGYIRAYKVGPHLIRIPRSELVRMRSVRMPALLRGDQPTYPVV